MHQLVPFALVALAPWLADPAAPRAGSDPFQRFELENGVRVCVLHAADAPKQSTFTLLPLGLLADGADRAQFAHLVEHLLIRGVDPESLEVDGIALNGETTANALRLETLAPPERWRESIARQARWLATRTVDPATLEREKGRIGGEEASTVSGGFTHKWAEAAWCQVVLHGRGHAAVHGDVAGASVESASAYLGERVELGPGVLVVSAGPIEAAALLEHLRKELGAKSESHASKSAALSSDAAWKPSDRTATWDLDARHYLEWYALPSGGAGDRASCFLVARAAQMQLALAKSSLPDGSQALASVLRLAPGRRGILISVSLPENAELASARKSVRNALDRIATKSTLSLAMRGVENELALPDFAALRKQLAGRPGADLIEAQIALNIANLELESDLTLPQLLEALGSLDAARLAEAAKKHLDVSNRCSLLLDSRE